MHACSGIKSRQNLQRIMPPRHTEQSPCIGIEPMYQISLFEVTAIYSAAYYQIQADKIYNENFSSTIKLHCRPIRPTMAGIEPAPPVFQTSEVTAICNAADFQVKRMKTITVHLHLLYQLSYPPIIGGVGIEPTTRGSQNRSNCHIQCRLIFHCKADKSYNVRTPCSLDRVESNHARKI